MLFSGAIQALLYCPQGRYGAIVGAISGYPTRVPVGPSVLYLIITWTMLFWWAASFLYHASVTSEMNYIDVRAMMVGMCTSALCELSLLAQRCRFIQSPGLRFRIFCAATMWLNLVALYTDFLSHRYVVVVPVLFVGGVYTDILRAMRNFSGGRRRRGWMAVASTCCMLVAVVLKAVDDRKIFCTTHAARTSLLQLTGIFHVLVGVGLSMKINLQIDEMCEGDIELTNEMTGAAVKSRKGE